MPAKNPDFKTEWDLSLIPKSYGLTEFSKLRESVEKESRLFIGKWKQRSDYLKDPVILKEALDEYNSWQEKWGANASEWYFYSLKSSLKQDDPETKALLGKARDFGLKIQNEIQFFELKLSKTGERYQKLLLSSELLGKYHHFLERLFVFSPHLLSEEEEKIMNLKSVPAHSNWTRMTQELISKEERESADEKGRVKKRNFSELSGLMESRDKKVRDSAAQAFNEILGKNVDVAEFEINSVLTNKKIDDELRSYSRPDESRHMADDVETTTVDALIKSVSSNFDVPKNYYRLKSELLGLKKLGYHERNVEYGSVEKNYDVSEGVELVKTVTKTLDPEFEEIFAKFLNEGRIDFYPAKGKRDGAFCSYNLITNPVYISLNWTDKLDDVRTLAHELGHGINDELIKKSQIAINFGTPTSTAEVASTFMEDFVIQELLKNADDETKLSLMMSKLNQDISSIFRQIACYMFEQELHKSFREKGFLPKEEIGNMFIKYMSLYMGDSVDYTNGDNWWVYWSHIRNFFYNYSYASGLLISKSLQSSVKEDPQFIEKVKEFMSAGLSDSPRNIFMSLGIDITDSSFWNKGIKEIKNLLEETGSLAKKLGKISY